MATYHNILLAVDFSATSEEAVVRAVDLAARYRARLTICHVVEHFPADMPVDIIPPEGQDKEKYIRQEVLARLRRYAERFGCADAEMIACVSDGAAKKALARLAHEKGVDLIVLGSRGAHGLGGLLGSTAKGLMDSVPCDVLAVRVKAS